MSETENKHCGCMASISPADPRSEIWLYVFNKLEFPIKHPFATVGLTPDPTVRCYEGLGSALTEEQKEKLIEKMIEKFGVSSVDVEKGFIDGIIPIRDTGIVVSWCRPHYFTLIMHDYPEYEQEEEG
jgi:hypothetical protein